MAPRSSRAAALSASSPDGGRHTRGSGQPAFLGAGVTATSGLPDRFCWVLRRPQATSTGQAYRRHRTYLVTCQHWLRQPLCSRADFLTPTQLIDTETDLQIVRPALEKKSPVGVPSHGQAGGGPGGGGVQGTPPLISLPLCQVEDNTGGPRAPAGGGGPS